jgi:hypothetical protein
MRANGGQVPQQSAVGVGADDEDSAAGERVCVSCVRCVHGGSCASVFLCLSLFVSVRLCLSIGSWQCVNAVVCGMSVWCEAQSYVWCEAPSGLAVHACIQKIRRNVSVCSRERVYRHRCTDGFV